MNISDIIADAWQRTLDESPDPWGNSALFEHLTGAKTTYRERLDRQPRNYRGELIPRIVTVRRNQSLHMRKPKRPPQLPA